MLSLYQVDELPSSSLLPSAAAGILAPGEALRSARLFAAASSFGGCGRRLAGTNVPWDGCGRWRLLMPTPPRCRAGWWSLVPAFLSFLLSLGGSSRRASAPEIAAGKMPACPLRRGRESVSWCVSRVPGSPSPVGRRDPLLLLPRGRTPPPWVVVRPRFVGARSLGRGRALRDLPRRALAVLDRGKRGCGTALTARLYHDAPEVKPQGLDIWLAS